MKRMLQTAGLGVLLLGLGHFMEPAEAACNFTQTNGTVTATSTCGIDTSATEAYDYSAGADDATNGTTLTINAGVTVTLNQNAALNIGNITVTSGGSLVVSSSGVTVTQGYRCYVTDADGDGYSPAPNTCYSAFAAGRIRKGSVGFKYGVDCGDGAAAANPGQQAAQATTFTNSQNPSLTGDWNCNGVQTKTYTAGGYTCNGCTNGSGYASSYNNITGYITVPNCGVAGTYYTVTNATCRDPAVGGCSGSYSTQSLTQTCI